MDPELKRALLIGGAAVAGVLVLVGIAFAVSGDNGKDTTSVQVPDRTSTSSSSTTSSSTSTSTSTTLPPITVPPTAPPTSPPTVVVIPPTAPPTAPPTTPPTAAPTTSSSSTTSSTVPGSTTTTTRPAGEEALNDTLETALNGGVAPAPGTPARVNVDFARDADLGAFIRVTWALDPTITTNGQLLAAVQEDVFTLLRAATRDPNFPDAGPVVLRATFPDPLPGDPQHVTRVVRLVYDRSTLDGISFTGPDAVDPATLYDLADQVDPPSPPGPLLPTTTSTT